MPKVTVDLHHKADKEGRRQLKKSHEIIAELQASEKGGTVELDNIDWGTGEVSYHTAPKKSAAA